MALKSKPLAKTTSLINPEIKPTSDGLVAEYAVLRMPLASIVIEPQVRTDFDSGEITALANDIAALGQLQPAVVRVHPTVVNKYILVAGGRRYKACEQLGRELLVVVVDNAKDADTVLDMQWSENHYRVGLSLQDQAAVFRKDLARLGTQSAVAKHRGVSEGHVSALLNVANEAAVPGSMVNKAIRAGIDDVSDLNTVNRISKTNTAAAEALIEKAKDTGKSVRQEAREVLQNENKARATLTGAVVAGRIHAVMGTASNGAELKALAELDEASLHLLADYVRPFFNAGAKANPGDVMRTLHKTCFAKASTPAENRWQVSAFMTGLVQGDMDFSLETILKQASYCEG